VSVMARRGQIIALLVVVFTAALGMRLVYLAQLQATPFAHALVGDSEMYDERGRAIAAGAVELGDRPYYQDPLYPYVLGAIYAARGHDLQAVRLLQALLAALAAVAVAATALRLSGRLAAAVAGGLYAVAPTLIFYDGQIEKTSLTVHLVAPTMLAWVEARRRGPRLWLVAGLGLGALALLRGNFILLLPPAVIAAWWQSGRDRRSAVALAVGIALPIVPATARNLAVSGELVLVTSQGGQNFYTGNHAGNQSCSYVPPPFLRPHPRFEELDFLHEAERRNGRSMSASEVSRYWWRQGLAAVRADPAGFARQSLRRLAWTFHPDDLADNIDMQLSARLTPLLAWRLPDLGLLVTLGLVGLALGACKRQPMAGFLLGYVALYAATLVAFFVFGRYRLPIVAALAVGAGLWAAGLRSGRRSVIASLAAVLGVGAALALLPSVPSSEAQALSTLGTAYEKTGDRDRAEAAYKEAFALEPHNPTVAYNLARLRYQDGDLATAELRVRASLAAFPTPEAHALLGRILLDTDRIAEAERALQLALERDPRLIQAIYWRAMAAERAGRVAAAIELYRRALELDGPDGNYGRPARRRALELDRSP